MSNNNPGQRVRKSVAVAALFAGLALALPARAETTAPECDAPLDLIRLANPLPRLAKKLTLGEPITIVAIGSSSTAGSGSEKVSGPTLKGCSGQMVSGRAFFGKRKVSSLRK